MKIQDALSKLKTLDVNITQQQFEDELASLGLYADDDGNIAGLTDDVLMEFVQDYQPKAIAPVKAGKPAKGKGGLAKADQTAPTVPPKSEVPTSSGVEQVFSESVSDIQSFIRGVDEASYQIAERGSDVAIATAARTSDRFLELLAQKSGQYQGNPDAFFRLGEQFAGTVAFD